MIPPTGTLRASQARQLLGAAALAVAALPARAAAQSTWDALDRRTATACAAASGLRNTTVAPAPVRFSDAFLVDARLVTGVYPQPHMKGARGQMLCLYNRRTRRAEAQELDTAWRSAMADEATRPAAPTAPGATARPIVDTMWVAEDIGGRGVVDRSRVTMMFDAGGKVGGKSGCNGYSARYVITGSTVRVIPPLIGTKMACPPAVMEQEARFQEILGAAASFAVDPAGALVLTASDGRTLRFMAERPRGGMVSPGPAAPGMPAFWNLRCGEEQFRASFAPDRALVELSDGTRVELPNDRAGGDPSATRVYTNGRLTFVQTIEGPDRGVTFARGRMVPMKCHVAQHG